MRGCVGGYMKKYMVLGFGVMIIGSGLLLGLNLKQENKIFYNKDIEFNASYITPNDLDQIQERSTLIVNGSFTGEREVDNDENVVGPSSISQFKVNEVYKGTINNDKISVIEPCEFENGNFTNVEGYIPMQEKEEYTIFLRENQTEYGKQYTIISLNFGKYNLSNKDNLEPISNDIKYFNDVSELDFVSQSSKECDIYNGIKEQVLNEYEK